MLLDSAPVETYDADGVTGTFDYLGPAMVIATEDVEIVENTTEYVFDVCDLLDQAATAERPAS